MSRAPRSHLSAALISVFTLIASLVGFSYYAQSLEFRDVNALAPLNLTQMENGVVLQRAALQKPDILMMYGSSELTLLPTPYQANQFFASYPTGFTVVDVASLGVLSVTLAQEFAALGPDLRGKKIVLSIMPGSFFINKKYFIENNPVHDFAMNFSPLRSYETIFSPYLSFGIKNEISRSLLGFRDTIRSDPFLSFAVTITSSTSTKNHVLYYLIWPLGELETQILRLQDHFEVVLYIWTHHIDPDVQKVPQSIDWNTVHQNALAEQIKNTSTNPYGVENFMWWYFARISLPEPIGSNDDLYTKNLLNSQEWTDFKILLIVLQQLGAKPLIISRPLNVPLWEVMGVTEDTQDIFYNKLHSVADPFKMPLIDFRQYDHDMYFSIDQGSHTSRDGWVYVDQILDAYYHGQLLP
ncbi:MAG TPA: D-alanyl-lipoteichoic acid biosynthesis protein DltD [Anaerolineales bacterium]|nr:D-alanyl-lipoteichoic acid biosynthesis protein DltD [Anaerolineales bacterium]